MSHEEGGDKPQGLTTEEIDSWLGLVEMFPESSVVLHGAAGEDAMNVGDVRSILLRARPLLSARVPLEVLDALAGLVNSKLVVEIYQGSALDKQILLDRWAKAEAVLRGIRIARRQGVSEPTIYSMRGGQDSYPCWAVRIDRRTKWGNPFIVGKHGTREQVIEKYEAWLRSKPDLMLAVKLELAGKDLLCWCAPLQCHGDVLLRIANGSAPVNYEHCERCGDRHHGGDSHHEHRGDIPGGKIS